MSYASYGNLGKPKAPALESMAEIERIISLEHRDSVKEKFPIVIIKNYTEWCGPCKTIAPLFAQLAKKYLDKYKDNIAFVKENAEDELEGAERCRGVPCFHFFLKGKFVPGLTVTGCNLKTIEENIGKLLNL